MRRDGLPVRFYMEITPARRSISRLRRAARSSAYRRVGRACTRFIARHGGHRAHRRAMGCRYSERVALERLTASVRSNPAESASQAGDPSGPGSCEPVFTHEARCAPRRLPDGARNKRCLPHLSRAARRSLRASASPACHQQPPCSERTTCGSNRGRACGIATAVGELRRIAPHHLGVARIAVPASPLYKSARDTHSRTQP